MDSRVLRLRSRRGRVQLFDAHEIDHIAEELAANWVFRGVVAVLATGKRVPILCRREWAVELYMFYDGLELLCDTGWVHGIGDAASSALGVAKKRSPHFDAD